MNNTEKAVKKPILILVSLLIASGVAVYVKKHNPNSFTTPPPVSLNTINDIRLFQEYTFVGDPLTCTMTVRNILTLGTKSPMGKGAIIDGEVVCGPVTCKEKEGTIPYFCIDFKTLKELQPKF